MQYLRFWQGNAAFGLWWKPAFKIWKWFLIGDWCVLSTVLIIKGAKEGTLPFALLLNLVVNTVYTLFLSIIMTFVNVYLLAGALGIPSPMMVAEIYATTQFNPNTDQRKLSAWPFQTESICANKHSAMPYHKVHILFTISSFLSHTDFTNYLYDKYSWYKTRTSDQRRSYQICRRDGAAAAENRTFGGGQTYFFSYWMADDRLYDPCRTAGWSDRA